MYRPIAFIMMLGFASAWSLSGATSDFVSSQTGTQQNEKKAPAKTNAASMTGCIDEQDGHYVLLDDQTRDPKASLEADGFETEGFAKYVGHKVTVRGTSSSEGTRPIFRVRSIESISDTCGPQFAH